MHPSIRSFIYGLSLPLRAGKLIFTHPSLLFWSILPVLVAGLLYFYLFAQMQSAAGLWVEHHFAGWTAWIMLALARITLVILGVFTFSVAGSIVAAPFNDLLAERVEPLTSPPLVRVKGTGFRRQLRIITIDILKSLAAAVAGLAALLLSWVPLLNLIAFVLAFLLLSFQFISYPQTRRGQGIGEGLRFLARNFAACLGFGMALTLLFAVPFVSALCLPVAVVSGTLLFGRAQRAITRSSRSY